MRALIWQMKEPEFTALSNMQHCRDSSKARGNFMGTIQQKGIGVCIVHDENSTESKKIGLWACFERGVEFI